MVSIQEPQSEIISRVLKGTVNPLEVLSLFGSLVGGESIGLGCAAHQAAEHSLRLISYNRHEIMMRLSLSKILQSTSMSSAVATIKPLRTSEIIPRYRILYSFFKREEQ